jgi:hypothetical protein
VKIGKEAAVPDTYIDVAATPGTLRAALIAEASGSAGSWKVFRLATGSHVNDLDSASIREKAYFRITAQDGATPTVELDNVSGLNLYNNANHWQIDANVTWQCNAGAANSAFTLLAKNTGWIQNIDIRCPVVGNANTAYVIKCVEPGGADWTFTGTFSGGNAASTIFGYGVGALGGTWRVASGAVISSVLSVVNPRCPVTAYVYGTRVSTFHRLADCDATVGATVITYNNLLTGALGSAVEGVWHVGAGVTCSTRLRAWHNTLVGATGKALYHNFSGAITELKFQNNILCEVTQGTDYQAKANFTQGGNIARACAFNGGSGGGDYTVVVPELVGFTNEGAGDYSLLWGAGTAPALRKAWDHCSSVGVTDDYIGTARPQSVAYDAGCYEAVQRDCGVVDATQIDNTHADVTFVPVSGSTALPLEASGEDPTNWSCATTGTPLFVDSVIKQVANRYRVQFDRGLDNETVTVTALGTMVSDQGGVCNNPTGNAQFIVPEIDCGIATITVTGSNTLAVEFAPAPGGSAIPVQASAETETNWGIATNAPGLFGALILNTAIRSTDYIYLLTFGRDFVDGEYITLTTSAIATNLGGNCDTPPTGSVSLGITGAGELEGPLAALLGATGHLLAQMAGTLTTRLRTTLNRTATTIDVESTLGFPDSGTLVIEREYIPYTGRLATSFTGCTRDTTNNAATYPVGWSPWPIGTQVYSMDQQWSSTDQAISDTRFADCQTEMLDWVAADAGSPRLLREMSVAGLRMFLSTLWFLDRTTWWSVFRVLETMYSWVDLSGTDGFWQLSGGQWWFKSAGLNIATSRNLHDNWIWIDDKLCRIIQADHGVVLTSLLLEPVDWPFWEGITHDHDTHSWRVVPFRLMQTLGGTYISTGGHPLLREKAGALDIFLYACNSEFPFTYLMQDSTQKIVLLDDRPIAGKLMSDTPGPFDPGPYAAGMENDPGNPSFGLMKAPLYSLAPYRKATKGVLADVISAGIRVEVYDMTI